MSELRALWRLALPIAGTQLAFMAMGVVDTLMAGPLGKDALAALALGNTFFFALLIFGIGLLMALETWVSRAYGAGRTQDVSDGLAQGLWLALIASPPLVLAMLAVPSVLIRVGYDPALVDLAALYLRPLAWGVLPALLFQAYRSALAAVNVTRPVFAVAVAANAANWLLNHWLSGGGLGVPALGAEGLAWSTAICRVVLLAPTAAVWHRWVGTGYPSVLRPPNPDVLRRLAAIGVPVGLSYLVEVSAFGGSTVLMGAKGATPLAAHQVALNVASVAFMIPLSVGGAAAVRCGQALGRGDPAGVRRAGWTAFGSGLGVALVAALLLVAFPDEIAAAYRPPPEVAELAVAFLGIAAVFQVVDSTQAVGVGVLRGLGDTRFPLGVVLVGYGLLALPLGWMWAFRWTDDPRGLWYGLTLGLSFVAVCLVARFAVQTRRLERELPPPPDAPLGAPWQAEAGT